MKKLAILLVCAAMLASCNGLGGGSKDLKAENDSLLMELTQRNAELDEMMGTFNEVQEGFRKINAAESRVDLTRGTISENSATAKQQIASDIEFITKQMEENKAQIAKLQAMLKSSKNKAINSAWFVFGTKSELKTQKILEKGDVLKSADFNKDYFTQIDIRTTKEIKLYSKRAELLTTHPAKSYELVKDDKGQLTLKITNPKEFWSVSKYLVIQVK